MLITIKSVCAAGHPVAGNAAISSHAESGLVVDFFCIGVLAAVYCARR